MHSSKWHREKKCSVGSVRLEGESGDFIICIRPLRKSMASVLRRIAVDSRSNVATARFFTQASDFCLCSVPGKFPCSEENSELTVTFESREFQSAGARLTAGSVGDGSHGGAYSGTNVRAAPEDGKSMAPSPAAYSRPGAPIFLSSSRLSSAFRRGSGGSVLCDCSGSAFPGVAAQSRGYAAKSKKIKARREQVSDVEEDVTASARQRAVETMASALDALSVDLSKLRTGRASPGMLDHITVVARGVRTPLSHVAAVSLSGLQSLSVLPYDASLVKEVEKSLLSSPLGLNPQVEGVTLTVPVPRLTKEHRETMCTLVGKAGESAKLAVRRARKEALDHAKKSGSLSKDETKGFEKEVEELTKRHGRNIDDLCKAKEKEIMA